VNVGRLIQYLSAFPSDMPVVLEARDEPLGDYEVATVDRARMEHDRTYDQCGTRVYYRAPSGLNSSPLDPPCDVVLLGFEDYSRGVVDAGPVRSEQQHRRGGCGGDMTTPNSSTSNAMDLRRGILVFEQANADVTHTEGWAELSQRMLDYCGFVVRDSEVGR